MDVGTNASTCFGIVNVRRATARGGHFRGEEQKMTVLEQTAFTDNLICVEIMFVHVANPHTKSRSIDHGQAR